MSSNEPQPDAHKERDDQTAIAKRAYELYLERNRSGDPSARDWEQAQHEILNVKKAGGSQPKAPDASGPDESASHPQPKPVQAHHSGPSVLVVALVLAVVIASSLGVGWWWWGSPKNEKSILSLHGNVDLRQVELAFNNSERIAAVLVQEGDLVVPGQVLARSDTSRLKPQEAEAEAALDAQRAVVDRLHHGSRPQEITQAQATVAGDRADRINAEQQWKRLTDLSTLTIGRAISQQELDGAKDALDTSLARLTVAEMELDLAATGPRAEDISKGEADLRVKQAQLDLMRQNLANAELIAPCAAVVRSRLLEPGEMASPQRPIVTLAIMDPKWIRAYIPESDLGKVHMGMTASISTDSAPGKPLPGWIGFIAAVAEFTPKTVQTEELRSSLVYEIRVFVKDPQDDLRLGMPATVQVDIHPTTSSRP
jgi:HlyD family secretion protein